MILSNGSHHIKRVVTLTTCGRALPDTKVDINIELFFKIFNLNFVGNITKNNLMQLKQKLGDFKTVDFIISSGMLR